jgi:hypothetical protein
VAKASDNLFPKVILVEAAAPATPASGTVIAYAKTDGLLYSKDDAGVETLVSGGSGGGGAPSVTDNSNDNNADSTVAANANSDIATVSSLVLGADDVVAIFATCQVRTASSSVTAGIAKVVRDSTDLEDFRWHNQGLGTQQQTCAIFYIDKPGAGTYTYKLNGSNDAGSAGNAIYSNRRLRVVKLSF